MVEKRLKLKSISKLNLFIYTAYYPFMIKTLCIFKNINVLVKTYRLLKNQLNGFVSKKKKKFTFPYFCLILSASPCTDSFLVKSRGSASG